VTEPRASKYLATYLNDHLAGATIGVELARRAASEHDGTPLGAFLAGLADEIAADRRALREFMAAVGAGADRKKVAFAWLVEKAGRLKPNAHLLTPSPLSPVTELEALVLGIEGKRLLWRALREVATEYGLPADRLEELGARAARQRDDVERQRVATVARALAR
jgi:hypothetical protein